MERLKKYLRAIKRFKLPQCSDRHRRFNLYFIIMHKNILLYLFVKPHHANKEASMKTLATFWNFSTMKHDERSDYSSLETGYEILTSHIQPVICNVNPSQASVLCISFACFPNKFLIFVYKCGSLGYTTK